MSAVWAQNEIGTGYIGRRAIIDGDFLGLDAETTDKVINIYAASVMARFNMLTHPSLPESLIEQISEEAYKSDLFTIYQYRIANDKKIASDYDDIGQFDWQTSESGAQSLYHTPVESSFKFYISFLCTVSEKRSIDNIKQKFYVENELDVVSYLQDKEYLYDALDDLNEIIAETFGDKTDKLSIEYKKDPEENDEGLVVYIYPAVKPEEALELLDLFDEKWFEVAGENVMDEILVNLRY
ncbi:hypothetical protein ACFL4X_01765 [Gemmatimonadota bacterium]